MFLFVSLLAFLAVHAAAAPSASGIANTIAGAVAAVLPLALQLISPYVKLDANAKRLTAYVLALIIAGVAEVASGQLSGVNWSSVQSVMTAATLYWGIGQAVYGVLIGGFGPSLKALFGSPPPPRPAAR